MPTRDDAIDALYGAPLGRFVAERTRLAAALRAAGDEEAATRLAKRSRPPTSAWAVNQLYRHARPDFDAMLSAAARLRAGDGAARGAHRDAVATLRHHAARLLERDGHAATEGTLRRVGANLAAIAARGGFGPDPPGALAADLAPPGFDVAVDRNAVPVVPVAKAPPTRLHAVPSAAERARAVAEREAAAARAEAARRDAERKRLATALRDAERERRRAEDALAALREKTRGVEARVAAAGETVRDLERRLRKLDPSA